MTQLTRICGSKIYGSHIYKYIHTAISNARGCAVLSFPLLSVQGTLSSNVWLFIISFLLSASIFFIFPHCRLHALFDAAFRVTADTISPCSYPQRPNLTLLGCIIPPRSSQKVSFDVV